MEKIGVLLINLGTPDSDSQESVRGFLKEFLSDPHVIDIPAFFRWLLVNLFILPFRTKKSTSAYQKIWQEAGSPLLSNSLQMKAGLKEALPDQYQVELGMRYGKPSIESAIAALKNCQNLIILPLFPQYSNAATGSVVAKVQKVLLQQENAPKFHIQKDFYDHYGFIKALAATIRSHLNGKTFDKLVFSYHGLPERQLSKEHCTLCDKEKPCFTVSNEALHCYRAQCYKSSQLIAQELDLPSEAYRVAFQSRLGRTPWIKPYTDHILPELIQEGVQNIAIVCPSFVADCLETLEEINIRARAQWQSLGGKELIFIPGLNNSPVWIKALAAMIEENEVKI